MKKDEKALKRSENENGGKKDENLGKNEISAEKIPPQIFVDKQTPLLNDNGELVNCGYSTKDVWLYNKENIADKGKLKEWEFYQVSNEKWLLQITYGHVTYAGNVAFTLLEFDTGKRYSSSLMKLFPKNSFALNFTSGLQHNVLYNSPTISLAIMKTPDRRNLLVSTNDKNCLATVNLSMDDTGDAMCYVMPFKNKLFYYNYKKLFTNLKGKIEVNGKNYQIDDKTHCLIDSGRGCWPYRHTWLWGMAQGKIGDTLFGFDVGYGNSDRGDTTENMLFVNGVAHKLSRVTAKYDKTDYLKPWIFSSADNRFEMVFTPFFDNFTQTNLLVIHNRCHQVFGHYSGKVVLDDGKVIEVENLNGFCEVAKNRW